MPTRSRLRRGFTLIEVMTAVVIVVILAALAVSYMMYGMGKARMNNTVFDVTAIINGAQLRAISRGSPHYVFFHQTPDNRVRVQVLERPDLSPPVPWATLDLTQGPDVALAFTRVLPDGSTETKNAALRDELVLGSSEGVSSDGIAFLDLDSTRIKKPLPAPFGAINLSTPTFTPSTPNKPTQSLMAGCNFCVSPSGTPYGVLRFNGDGTMDVITNAAASESGAVIAFAPNTDDEKGFAPKLLTISHPAGTTIVF